MVVHLRLTLEVLHDVQEAIVHVRHIAEAHFDLVKVTESILATHCQHTELWLDGRKTPVKLTYIQDRLLTRS